MQDYEKMYYLLFNAATDALEAMRQGFYDAARDMLTSAQQKAEEAYIFSDK